ncbi:MAG: ABC transporter ATP-binding protein [Alphaproteobacteria bacterium]|nr:ABC transporter ATP-binding protein [Alphaproteobacteria bacterium]
MTATPLLELRDVGRTFSSGVFSRRRVRAVAGVSFALEAGRPEVFAVIGESGSGKTTLARMILGAISATEGAILFRGRDLRSVRSHRDRLGFMRAVQPIFQNPFEAFNPLKRVDRYLFASAHRLAAAASKAEVERLADTALHQVGLSLAEVSGRFPHELSGGQLQRTAIARALISRPSLIVADEPVSMIDASLRMTVTNLFRSLRDELGVSIVYITHDLATAYYVSDRIIIMRKGEVVERGEAAEVLRAPQHPYSVLLKESVLSIDSSNGGDAIPSR